MHMYVRICICVCVYVHMYVCMYVRICQYVCMWIYSKLGTYLQALLTILQIWKINLNYFAMLTCNNRLSGMLCQHNALLGEI